MGRRTSEKRAPKPLCNLISSPVSFSALTAGPLLLHQKELVFIQTLFKPCKGLTGGCPGGNISACDLCKGESEEQDQREQGGEEEVGASCAIA